MLVLTIARILSNYDEDEDPEVKMAFHTTSMEDAEVKRGESLSEPRAAWLCAQDTKKLRY